MRQILICLLIGLTWTCGTASAANGATRSVDLRYVAHVEAVPPDAARLALWIPLPQTDLFQEISDLAVTCPLPYEITTEEVYGNKTLYLETEDPPADFDVEIAFSVTRRENGAPAGRNRDAALVELALQSQTLIPLSEEVRKRAEEIVAGHDGAAAQARALYDHTLNHMAYDKSGAGWGRGDYRHACDVGRGNCTDFHSYFIALCRNIGIPAYFEIGVSLPAERGEGKTGGYHCWAYFWDGEAWVPVDISEADKHPDRAAYFFGAHDENRVAFTKGRDLILRPAQAGGPLNFLIHPYAEVDGNVYLGVSKEVFYEDGT
ncbi:MAG: transglutaminase domain-containing protein [Candidatus Coatesbacteria bacterium]|nr:MAG: transglutaminase domain-containing protein [Candidatus Coatesbacteria bacterium]